MTAVAVPVDLLPVDETAKVYALDKFRAEYASKTCAVCESHKWANSPFCRLCSIKLQRKHMMWVFNMLLRRAGTDNRELAKWKSENVIDYWRHYETCRDYLIVTRRDGERKHGGSIDDSEI